MDEDIDVKKILEETPSLFDDARDVGMSPEEFVRALIIQNNPAPDTSIHESKKRPVRRDIRNHNLAQNEHRQIYEVMHCCISTETLEQHTQRWEQVRVQRKICSEWSNVKMNQHMLDTIRNNFGSCDEKSGKKIRFTSVKWEGVDMCQKCYAKVLGVGVSRVKRAVHSVNEGIIEVQGNEPHNKGAGVLQGIVIGWMQSYFDAYGESMPNTDRIHLGPTTKQELFDDMKGELIDSKQITETEVSYSYFCRIWKSHFHNVKIPAQPRMGKCKECTTLKERIQKERDPSARLIIRAEKKKHCDKQMLDRKRYWSLRDQAIKHPEQILLIHADGMDQVISYFIIKFFSELGFFFCF